MSDPVLQLMSIITCPLCGTAAAEIMPEDSCRYVYVCTGCGTPLKPKPGNCCVFCSYGSVVCPPEQLGQGGCMPSRECQ